MNKLETEGFFQKIRKLAGFRLIHESTHSSKHCQSECWITGRQISFPSLCLIFRIGFFSFFFSLSLYLNFSLSYSHTHTHTPSLSFSQKLNVPFLSVFIFVLFCDLKRSSVCQPRDKNLSDIVFWTICQRNWQKSGEEPFFGFLSPKRSKIFQPFSQMFSLKIVIASRITSKMIKWVSHNFNLYFFVFFKILRL